MSVKNTLATFEQVSSVERRKVGDTKGAKRREAQDEPAAQTLRPEKQDGPRLFTGAAPLPLYMLPGKPRPLPGLLLPTEILHVDFTLALQTADHALNGPSCDS